MTKTYRDHIKAAVKKHKDTERAVKYAKKLLDNDPDTGQPWKDQLFDNGVRAEVHTMQAAQRRQVKAKARHDGETAFNLKPCKRGAAVINATVEATAYTLLDTWTVRTGSDSKALGKFTGTEILVEAEKTFRQVAGLTQNGQFYQWLGKKAGGRVIGKAVSGEEAAKKWCEISGNAA